MVPPAFAPSHPPPNSKPEFGLEENLLPNLGEVPKAVGPQTCAITGASRLSYNIPKEYSCESNIPFAGAEGEGEVDFAVCPAASHCPAALWTVEQLLVFTLFYWA